MRKYNENVEKFENYSDVDIERAVYYPENEEKIDNEKDSLFSHWSSQESQSQNSLDYKEIENYFSPFHNFSKKIEDKNCILTQYDKFTVKK